MKKKKISKILSIVSKEVEHPAKEESVFLSSTAVSVMLRRAKSSQNVS